MAATVAGRDEADLVEGLAQMQELLRDSGRMLAGLPSDASLDPHLSARLSRLGERLGAARTARLVVSIQTLRADLRYNLNRTYVAESLLSAVAGGPLP